MNKMLFLTSFIALSLAACTGRNSEVAVLNAPPPPAVLSGDAPTVLIAAPVERVQGVIVSRAASKGSVVKVSGNGRLVLERELPVATPEVIAACGQSPIKRRVRVVMTLRPTPAGTQLSERRFIVDNETSADTCQLPLSSQDYAQSISAMSAVKAQAEK